jgi:hypothetical protein
LKDGDGALVGRIWFVDKSAPSDFEASGKDASSEDKGDQLSEKGRPLWMHAGKNMKREAVITCFSGHIGDVCQQRGQSDGEDSRFWRGRVGRINRSSGVIEGPSSQVFVVGGSVASAQTGEMLSKEVMSLNDSVSGGRRE